MLLTANDLSAYTLKAGEPFFLEVQLKDSTGAVLDLTERAFVLSFYREDRSTEEAIDGEQLIDATGRFLRFARDGRFSEEMYGKNLTVELAERYLNGRAVVTSGRLNVERSAAGVPSLGNGVVTKFVTRITVQDNAVLGGPAAFTQQQMLYRADAVSPPVTLAVLSLSDTLSTSNPSSGTIVGATAGSTISESIVGLTVDSGARTYAWDGTGGAGTFAGGLVETHPNATNSGRASPVTIVVGTPATIKGIVNDGDSITEGPNYIPVRPPRPEILAAITGLETTNLGVSGRKLEAMDATFGSRNVAGLFNNSSRNTLSLLGGINDIGETTTVDQLRGWITSYVSKARAAGFRVNLGTVTPNGDSSPTINQTRQGFNAWLRSNYQSIGAQTLADYDSIPEAALTSSTLWYVDRLHPTPRLLAKMALAEARAMGVAITQFNPNPRFSSDASIGGYVGYYYNTSYAIQPQDSAQLSHVDGKLRITSTSARWFPEAHIEINGLVVGQNYRLAYDVPLLSVGAGYGTRARVAENVGDDFSKTPAYPQNADQTTGSKVYDFTATKTSMAITLQLFTDKAGYGDFDNITVVSR